METSISFEQVILNKLNAVQLTIGTQILFYKSCPFWALSPKWEYWNQLKVVQ